MPKSRKTVPIYEYPNKINGQIRYYIRPYINGKQIKKRLDENGKMWLGRDGYNRAIDEIYRLERDLKSVSIDTTFNELVNIYLDNIKDEIKKSTYYNYLGCIENTILPYFNKKRVIDYNKMDILNWKDKIKIKKYSIGYARKCYRILANIFDISKNFGFKDNIVKEVDNFKLSESKVIKDDEKIRYITYNEFNKFIAVIDDIMWKTFFIFLYYTGCRKGEVIALTWNDINFNDNIIEINKTLNSKLKGSYEITNTKNSQNRKIKMSNVLIEQLNKYKNYLIKNKMYNKDNYVFGNDRFLPLTTIENKKRKYFKLSKVKEITIHEFRHSHVSLLINEYLKSGQTDATKFFIMMSSRMGHTIEVMQSTYMHLFPTIQNEIIDLLNNL